MWVEEMRMENVDQSLPNYVCLQSGLFTLHNDTERLSVWMRCEVTVWEWGFSCCQLWSLSCVCCRGLHPRGRTGRSPLGKGLASNQSPLEYSKRNTTKSQSQEQNYFVELSRDGAGPLNPDGKKVISRVKLNN